MKPLRALALPALACAALAPAISGCGAEDVAQVGLAEAAQKTTQARVAHIDGTVRLSGMGMPIPMTIKIAGTTALDAPEMDVTLDLAPLAGLAGVPASAAKPRIVATGGRIYGQVPQQFRRHIPGGREWVSVQVAPLAKALGLDARALSKAMRLDLESQLAVLRRKGLLKKAGTTELRGTKVTRWRGKVSTRDSLTGLSAAERKAVEKALRKFEAGDLDKASPYEVWVGEDGLVRRVICSSEFPASHGLAAGKASMTFDLSQFGKPAPVKAPPAGSVKDFTDDVKPLLRDAARGQHGSFK